MLFRSNSGPALMSTANFLKAHGWRAGAGYQPGEPNFDAIQAWNAASVYQRAIAQVGKQIDGGEALSTSRPRSEIGESSRLPSQMRGNDANVGGSSTQSSPESDDLFDIR